MKKISVIVPVYGVEKYIEKCISSIVNQTYKNLEIIIVNDGTKDNSIKIVEEKFKDDRIIILNKENGGISSARNMGLKYSTGDYISFVDSDDWLDESLYEKILSNTNNEDIIAFNYVYYNEKEKKLEKVRIKNKKLKNINKGYLYFRETSHSCLNKIYKKEYLEKIGIYFLEDLKIGEDICWNMETLFLTNNVKFLDIKGYFYRYKREFSLTNSTKKDTELKSYIILVKKIKTFIEKNKNQMNEISILRLELEKEFWNIKVTNKIKYKEIVFKIKKYFKNNKSIEDYIIIKTVRDILRLREIKNSSEIDVFDLFFWKKGVYNLKTFLRVIKNKNR